MTSIFEYNEERAMKYIREDEYSKGVKAGEKAGIELGQKLGRKEGREEGTQFALNIIKLHNKGMNAREIAEKLSFELEKVEAVIAEYEKE